MTEKNPAVSVIVALYNAEKYIGECLTSLANQTLKNFEIIVVDDCSTDNSRAVVENFFAKFGDRLKLMMISPNSGRPGVPRNFAMTEAHGEYIFFLDADDLLTETALEELYLVAKKFKADVVHAEKCLAFFDADGISTAEEFSFQKGTFVVTPTLETSDIAERMKKFIDTKFVWWACSKLFRRKFLVDNKITFPATKTYEDLIFTLKCVLSAKKYVRVPNVFYYYRTRKDSLSHKTYDVVNFSMNAFEAFRALTKLTDDEKFFRDNPQYVYRILNFFMEGQLYLVSQGLFVRNKFDSADVFKFFRDKIFSQNPEDNVALTTYLFVAINVLNLGITQQAAEIDALKAQLAAQK